MTDPTRWTDEAVWAEGGKHQPAALGFVFERHVGRVYGHCLRHLTSVQDAEDATSSVFFEAWRRYPDVRFVEGSALPWLLVTATNMCRNLSRAQRRYRHQLSRLPPPDMIPDVADDVAHWTDAAAEAAVVDHAFRRLNQMAQQVLTLCDVEGLTYEQAAEVIGVPTGTIRSRLSRARAAMRRQITSSELLSDELEHRLARHRTTQ